jgi:hypothetical protein
MSAKQPRTQSEARPPDPQTALRLMSVLRSGAVGKTFDGRMFAVSSNTNLPLITGERTAKRGWILPDQLSPAFTPSCDVFGGTAWAPGVYLFPAVTGRGKTIHLLALALASAAQTAGFIPISPTEARIQDHVEYITCNEPRGPQANPEALFAHIFNPVLVDERVTQIKPNAQLYLVDSLTSTLLEVGGRPGAGAAMKSGLTPAVVRYLGGLNAWCVHANITIVGTLNSTLTPTTDLEGAVEGKVRITTPGVVEIRDRDKRLATRVTLSDGNPSPMSAATMLLYGTQWRKDGVGDKADSVV